MTSPTPSGADAAGARNRAAVEQLEEQAAVPVRVAIYAVLARLLDDLGPGVLDDGVTPTLDAATVAARSAWSTVVDRITAWVRSTFTRLLTRAADNLDDLAPDIPGPALEDRVSDLVDQLAADLDSVPDTVASRVATTLREGYERGDTPQELRRRVAAVLDRDEWDDEVVRIARTTTTTVYNAAHTAAANELERSLGRPLRRMWIATQDTRTRPTHRRAHAQVVESGERFRVGDSRLRFPGDPLGPADEVILCRCVVVPVVNDMVIDLARRVTRREADVLDDETAEPMAAAVLTAVTRMPPQFVTYWTVGAGGARIRWNTGGDFTRCQRALRRYLDVGQVDGACANLHKLATGRWPGENSAVADEGEDTMPCPCENDTAEETDALAATVIGDPDLPLAGRDTDWDGDAAADRVRAWATPDGAELVDAERYARAFFWRDPDGEPETEAAYKLGFADVIDGELTAVPAGIFAVASVLEGGRGGVEIPEDEQDRVRGRVGAYYERMAAEWEDPEVVAPWAGDETPADDSGGEMTAGRYGITAATLEEARTMGMIALVPSEADAARLAVEGDTAIPAEELHVTLAFLGPGEPWLDSPEGVRVTALAEAIAADIGPITGRIWATATANPDSDDPTAVYLVGDDTGRLAEVAGGVHLALSDLGDMVPVQHSPWVAHISTSYGTGDTTGMAEAGTEVVLDRIRVSFADTVTDFPLTGDDTLDLDDEEADPPEPVDPEEEAMPEPTTATATVEGTRVTVPAVALAAAIEADTVLAQAAANAPQAPPAAWFRPVAVDAPTPPTVTAEGRVWGHIGQSVDADGSMRCHVGITDECVPIPPTRTAYGAFHREEIATAEGDVVAVGYLYTGCGHSDLGMDIDEARGYLDASCTRTAAGRVYDTDHGPMFVGSLLPGVTARNVAQLWKLSGEWFTAPLELHAAVGVKDAGFPVDNTGDAVRVADAGPDPIAASACQCPAGEGCPCAVTAATPVPDNDGVARPEPGDSDDDDGCECPKDTDPADCDCPGTDDDAPDNLDEPMRAVAEIDQYWAGRARRTTDPAVVTATRKRARRTLGHYSKRG